MKESEYNDLGIIEQWRPLWIIINSSNEREDYALRPIWAGAGEYRHAILKGGVDVLLCITKFPTKCPECGTIIREEVVLNAV